jgi:uncharacterized surface protein with fasciclin (FAS1) repeats
LVTAVKAADLVATLKGPGPFTVFAPTDAAFAKLPSATLTSLLQPENKQKLASILTYHVVPGKVMAADVVKLTSAKTVNGQAVSIKHRSHRVHGHERSAQRAKASPEGRRGSPESRSRWL